MAAVIAAMAGQVDIHVTALAFCTAVVRTRLSLLVMINASEQTS